MHAGPVRPGYRVDPYCRQTILPWIIGMVQRLSSRILGKWQQDRYTNPSFVILLLSVLKYTGTDVEDAQLGPVTS